MDSPFVIERLQQLLKTDDSDSEDEIDKPKNATYTSGPGDIGSKANTNSSASVKSSEKQNPNDIWNIDEIPESSEYDNTADTREEPKYEFYFKQKVATEDVFLQMGAKTPATASCEEIVIKIQLPNTRLQDITSDLQKTFLDCRTPHYKLGLHLPNPVDADSAKAEWDKANETLIITASLNREYDFLNF